MNILDTSFKRKMDLITHKDTHTHAHTHVGVSPLCFNISVTIFNYLNFICLKKDLNSSVFPAPSKIAQYRIYSTQFYRIKQWIL